jgi:signal transduction histidine kinase
MASQTSIYLTLITGLSVLAVLMILFGISFIRNQRKSIMDYKERMLREIALIELERKRIAADLHDDLGSGLAAIRLGVESLSNLNPSAPIGKKITSALERSIERLKEISLNLSPKVLHARGLVAAIKELEAEINSTVKIHLSVNATFIDTGFKPENTILVFRIIQEIIANALKHAQATKITVDLHTKKNDLDLRIADNGIGFDAEKLKRNDKQSGLSNIQSRLEILNASVKLETGKSKGTSYSIKIPLNSLGK